MENDEIKQKILDEISKTELLIVEYKELTQPIAPDVAIGRISRMDAINNKSVRILFRPESLYCVNCAK
jgi:DnaK suppressor protein